MSWTQPHHGPVGVLRLIHSPHHRGLGIYEDVEGVRWDVKAIMPGYVCARRLADHPGFYSTAGTVENSGGISATTPNPIHQWLPYRVEVVGDREETVE